MQVQFWFRNRILWLPYHPAAPVGICVSDKPCVHDPSPSWFLACHSHVGSLSTDLFPTIIGIPTKNHFHPANPESWLIPPRVNSCLLPRSHQACLGPGSLVDTMIVTWESREFKTHAFFPSPSTNTVQTTE